MTFNFQLIFCSLGDKMLKQSESTPTHTITRKKFGIQTSCTLGIFFGSLSIPMNKLEQIKKKFRRDPY